MAYFLIRRHMNLILPLSESTLKTLYFWCAECSVLLVQIM